LPFARGCATFPATAPGVHDASRGGTGVSAGCSDGAGRRWIWRATRGWQGCGTTSLVQRMAFVALVPTLITAALLVTLLTQRQLETLHQMARGNANAIATQTASLCVQPL